MGLILWYKRDPNAALGGFLSLPSPEVIGVYALLLELIYCRDDKLVDDDRDISRAIGLDLRVYRRARAVLLERDKIFIETVDGIAYLRNRRATKEAAEALDRMVKAETAAQARWNKQGATSARTSARSSAQLSDSNGRKSRPHRNTSNGLAHAPAHAGAYANHNHTIPPLPPKGGIDPSGGKGSVDAAGDWPLQLDDGRVWVEASSAAGIAWDEYLRKTRGRPSARDPRGGWYQRSAWPPSHGSGDQSPSAEGTDIKTAAGGTSKAQQTAKG